MHDNLSELAQRLGRYMAGGAPMGSRGILATSFWTPSRARTAGPEGLVTLSRLIGPKLPRARTTVQLFLACDAALTGHDPVEDSVVLARLLLEKPELGGNTRSLEQASRWERRRFNPAFALLIPCVAADRVRKSIQNDYPTMGLILVDEDIVELRRYIKANC